MQPINNAANSLGLGSKSIPNTSHQMFHTYLYTYLSIYFFFSV